MNTFGEPCTMVLPAQPVVSPARAAALPSTTTPSPPEVMVLGPQELAGVFREACERDRGECRNGKKHRQRLGAAATHSGTRSRARKGGTGMAGSASSAAFASTSFTMPVMMSLSWKSFGV